MSNKSVDIEILLRETIVEGVKKAKEAIKDLDSGAKDSTKNFNEEIKQQKLAVKGLIDEIAKLKKELEKVPSPAESPMGSVQKNVGLANGLSAQIKAREKDLITESMLLDDLQKKKIDRNSKEESSQSSLIASLGKWAIGIASVAGAMELGKKIFESTELTAHKFEQVIESAASGINYFFQSIASGDWSNFSDGLSIATRGASDYIDKMEEVKNLTNQDLILSAEYDKQIATAREKTYDKGKDNNAERLSGYDEWISLTEKKYTGLIETKQKAYKALIEKASTDTGGKTPVDEIDKFISKYRDLEDMMKEGEHYNKLTEDVKGLNKASGYGAGREIAAAANEAQRELAAMGETGRKAGEMAFNIGKIIFPVRDELAKTKAALIGLEAMKEQGPTFAKRSRGALLNSIERDAEAAAKKAKEDAELDNRIKATRELMNGASGEELTNLALKLTALEKEKKLRDDLINQAIMLARDDSSALLPLNMNMGEMSSRGGQPVTSKLASKIDSREAKNDLVDSTKKFIKQKQKEGSDLSKEEEDWLKRQKELRLEILDAVMSLTYQLAQQVGMSEEDARVVGGLMEATMKAVSGDYVGAAMATLSTVIALIPTHAQKFQAQIKEINALLEKQQRLIAQSSRLGGESSARQDEIRTLEEKRKALEAEQKRLKNKTGFLGLFTGKKKLAEVNDELAKLEQQIDDANTALTDFFAGGVTQSTLADSIAQAFMDGKGSVDDFGNYTNKILQDAVLSAFKANILGDTLTNAQKLIAAAFEDKTLTAEEIAAIRSAVQSAGDEAKVKMDALTKEFPEMFSDTASSSTGMTANIKAITEETASALGGNISAIRINMARLIESGNTSMSMLQQSLEYQLRTADNTEEMGKTLLQIDNRLSRIELDGLKVK